MNQINPELMDHSNHHNLPCWCGDGTSCASLYQMPKPHLHCFKCGKQNYSTETIEEISMIDANLMKLIGSGTEAKGNNLQLDRTGLFPQRGIIAQITQRGISKETAEKFGVETLFQPEDMGGQAYGISCPAFDDNNQMIAQKVKKFDKTMKWLYNTDKLPDNLEMFGQHLVPSGGKFITITEGEEDAMAAYQMLKESSPAFEPAIVSLFNGATSAERDCKKHWEYINSFENIILAFDGDELGRKAAEKVSRLFNYRPKVLFFNEAKKVNGIWELKDANDYLKAGKAKDFVRMWWKSEKVTPKGVVSFKSLWDPMTKQDSDLTVPYPWAGLNKLTHGMRTGELVIIKAPPKMGKTQILREIAYHIRATTNYNTGLIFLEDTKKSIGLGMCALHVNKPIHFPDVPCDIDELKKAHEFLSEDDRLTVFDPEDDRTVENIFNKILYFVKAHECKFIILDHISMLAYQNAEADERRFLDKLLADLKNLTTQLNVGILAVTHVNDDGKTRGSRAAVQLCNMLFALHRDKLNPDPITANTLEVVVEENRKTGESGLACKLFFDRETGRMTELDTDLSMSSREREVDFDK